MRRALALVPFVALLAFAAGSASQADVVVNSTTYGFGDTTNPCNGETIDFTVAVHNVVRETVASDGSTHFGIHANARGQGVGATTGAKYAIVVAENDADNEGVFAGGQGAAEETLVVSAEFIAQGTVPNFTAEVVEHITLTPDGTITALVVDVRTSCPLV